MKILSFIFVGVLSTSTARPQNGYNYNTPSRGPFDGGNQFGSQSINFENFVDGNNLGRPNNAFGANGFGVAQSNSGFLTSNSNFNGNNGGSFNGNLHTGGGFNGNLNSGPAFNANLNPGFGGNLNSGSSFGGNLNVGGLNPFQTRPTLIQKHIYVHVPPPSDDDDILPQRQIANAAIPQKHYKIIFIKAPSVAPSISQAQIALAAQSQEKTIVYVLVKKPDDISELAAASAPISAPTSKPEVYFIKYKTQKEQRNNGLNGFNAGSSGFNVGSNGFNVGSNGFNAGSSGLVSSLSGSLGTTLGSSISVSGASSGSANSVIGLGGIEQGLGSNSLGSVAPLQGSGTATSAVGVGSSSKQTPSIEYGPPGYNRPF